MGRSQADKAETHDRIIARAAARLRERGVEGFGVAELMQEAGLTHGGFYRHFESRDELVAEGVERALAEGARGAFEAEARSGLPRQTLLCALVDWYLGIGHRDALASSCAVTSLAADVARGGERLRSAYTQQFAAYVELFVRLMPADWPQPVRRAKTLAAWPLLVGALSLARAVNDEGLSREILSGAAEQAKALLTQP